MTRILEYSEDQIHLRSQPRLWLTAALALLSLVVLIGFCPSYELICRRTEPHAAQIQVRSQLFGIPLSLRTLEGVTSARVERSGNSSRNRRWTGSGVTLEHNNTSRLLFVTGWGSVALTRWYLEGQTGQQQAAEALNHFLSASTEANARFRVPASRWFWGIAIALAVVSMGTVTGSWCNCWIDRSNNQIRITWPNLLGRQTAEYPLSEVERFEVLAQISTPFLGRLAKRLEHSVGMRLHDGREISLTRESSSKETQNARDVAAALERFRSSRKGALATESPDNPLDSAPNHPSTTVGY